MNCNEIIEENKDLKRKLKIIENSIKQFNAIKNAYDKLIKKFKEKDKKLIELNEKLETMVKERTLELEKKNFELEKISITDMLTGLKNRRAFDEVFNREFNRANRQEYEFNLLIIDIDHFKNYNDEFGHKAGDEILSQVGKILKGFSKRANDFTFRYGGEEFAYISCFHDYDSFLNIAEIIRKTVEEETCITISIGGVVCKCKKKTKNEVFNIADINLYNAKNKGRNRVCLDSIP